MHRDARWYKLLGELKTNGIEAEVKPDLYDLHKYRFEFDSMYVYHPDFNWQLSFLLTI